MATLKNTTIDSTGFINLPSGTTAQRPGSPTAGMIRYNTTLNEVEIYSGTEWQTPSTSGVEAEGGFVFDTNIGGIPYRIHYFSTKFKYLSRDSGNATGGSGGGLNSSVRGESDAIIGGCSGLVTFEQALELCHSNGVRLPTREEVVQGVAEGTGCGYDAEQIWTCDKADPLGESHYTIIGDWPVYGYSSSIRSNTDTAYVRWASDVDLDRLDPNWIDDPFIYNWLQNNYPDQLDNTFTVTNGGEIEYLIVAGGGSGGVGSNGGGGGGAGGLLTGTTTVTPQSYTINVGLGGPRRAGRGIGANGGNSTAFGLTATGGGYGGGTADTNGNSGGSGGGGMYSATGSSGTTGQGNAGGTGDYALGGSHDAGGGGGGAGSAGKDASNDQAGDGGSGIVSSITGEFKFYAGGGGGASNRVQAYHIAGKGGQGGGGIGGISLSGGGNAETCRGTNGTPGLGGGGGGGSGNSLGESGAGGSGAVIIRYPKKETITTSPNAVIRGSNLSLYGPIKENLIFWLDFSNPLCYPGYKNTATDLANGRQGSVLATDATDTPYILSANNGVYFTSNNQFMDFDNPFNEINMYTEPFTISHWVLMNFGANTGHNYQLFSKLRHSNNSYYGYKMGRDFSDSLGFSFHTPDLSARAVFNTLQPMPRGRWVQCTVAYDGGTPSTSTVRMYVDGVQQTTLDTGWTLSYQNLPGTIRFGGRSRSISGDELWYLNGRLGTALMYNRALSSDEIFYNYNATRTGGI